MADVCQALTAALHAARSRHFALFQGRADWGQARDEAVGADAVVGRGLPGESPTAGSDILSTPRANMHLGQVVGAGVIQVAGNSSKKTIKRVAPRGMRLWSALTPLGAAPRVGILPLLRPGEHG